VQAQPEYSDHKNNPRMVAKIAVDRFILILLISFYWGYNFSEN
jgi:hypothetical protein